MIKIKTCDLIKNKFYTKIRIKSSTECWEWIGGKSADGYGIFYHRGEREYAHRLSFALYKTPIPKKILIRHTCDNPSCVNPDHLLLGNQRLNARDALMRKRDVFKLTPAKVIEIRESRKSYKELARVYKVDRTTISHIKRRKTWKHLP
jgi:hypothetical protein